MKAASPALIALLNAAIAQGATSTLYSVDLYTFTPLNGPVIRLCTGDFDAIDNAGNVYSCGSIGSGFPKIDLKQSKVQGQWTRGLDDDQWTVALLPTVQDPFTGAFTYPDVFGATPWLAACRFGMFSGAPITVARAYWAAPPTPAQIVAEGVNARTCVGSVVVYGGIIGEVDATQTLCFFNCSSYKYLLSMNLPRNLVQGSCRNLLYDARCGLNAASFAQTATAQAGSTSFNVIATAPTPGGSGTYTKGRMVCTAGANLGLQRMITNWTGGAFQPQYPWPFPVAAGDTFTVYPGCDKSTGPGGCGGFYGASYVNFFAGAPFVPQPEIQIG
jgi:hypothetical protein